MMIIFVSHLAHIIKRKHVGNPNINLERLQQLCNLVLLGTSVAVQGKHNRRVVFNNLVEEARVARQGGSKQACGVAGCFDQIKRSFDERQLSLEINTVFVKDN